MKRGMNLTPRQREVLKAIASVKPPKQAADDLGITWHTFRTHRKNIYERLGIHSLAEAIRHAAKMSLL